MGIRILSSSAESITHECRVKHKILKNILSTTVFKLNMGRPEKLRSELDLKPGACFSKVSKLFGRILGDIILFVSSKGRCLEAQNFAVIFIFIPFTTYEKTSFAE